VQTQTVVYEQPLNERVRAFLRLEFLFDRAAYRTDGPSVWDSRASLDALIDIMAILARSDLKSEVIKELERDASILSAMGQKPGVDPHRLNDILDQINELLGAVRTSDSPPGQDLRQDELISYVRQRTSIPAGTYSFDIPALQYWLERPAEERVQTIRGWFSEFDPIREAVGLCLDLIRGSGAASRELAEGGFFQRSLEPSNSCQLIRVMLPEGTPCFPEVSGGRHRFTIRFMQQPDTAVRPSQVGTDVSFRLQCCTL